MNENDTIKQSAVSVFAVALLFRIGGVVLTTLTDLNPDSKGDVGRFAGTAQAYATGELGLSYFMDNLGTTYPTWGFFISPFWHIPGPSRIYARLGIAVVGAFAIYNVYLIVTYYTSKQAGRFAVAPLIILPSFVALHSVVLRDAAILCGITYAIRLLTVPSRWRDSIRYTLIVIAIGVVTLLRIDNVPVYAAMAAVGVILWIVPRKYYRVSGVITGILAVISYPVSVQLFRWLGILTGDESPFEFLLFMRRARIGEGGRTQYLANFAVETPIEAILYAPIGAVYFLFSPFPGMAEIAVDYITVMESLVTMGFAIVALPGAVALWRRNRPLAGALLVGLVLFALVYGVISTNVGTSVRQRQVLSWVIFAFGGIGIAQRYHLHLQWFKSENDETMASD